MTDAEFFAIDTRWIFKVSCYAIYGIVISKMTTYIVRDWINKDGIIKIEKNVKFRSLYLALTYILYIIPTFFFSAVIVGFLGAGSKFVNLTIVTAGIAIPTMMYEVLTATIWDKKNKSDNKYDNKV